jgi:hypothetical protein
MNTDNLKPVDSEDLDDDLLPEYDEATLRNLLKNGVRGKYVDRYRQGTNLIKLDPDIADAFPPSNLSTKPFANCSTPA